ncbi:hypothetical protein BC830DRAFT_1123218 [Chytriomyces sp. MP71]|nr:hypothetical protein BC830DRAFT_1123218 [Chytriomyces sp. MP71]
MSSNSSRLLFTIQSCSSYDEGFAASELLTQSPSTPLKGWQSERFCTFPQTLVLKLASGSTRLHKVQLLSHHFKIASKLEFFVGASASESSLTGARAASSSSASSDKTPKVSTLENGIRYTRLGFVSLGDNSASEFKAREFKSIHVDAHGEFVKIVLHKNHINSLNLFNQVGLVSVSLLGASSSPQNILDQQFQIAGGLDPLLTDFAHEIGKLNCHDEAITKIINVATKCKQDAVKSEDYMLARSLKIVVDLARKADEEVSKLLLLKAKSIDLEDYDMAEDAKADIEQIKAALNAKISDLGLQIDSSGLLTLKPEDTTGPPALIARTVIHTSETTVDVPRSVLDKDLAAFSSKEFSSSSLSMALDAVNQPTTFQKQDSATFLSSKDSLSVPENTLKPTEIDVKTSDASNEISLPSVPNPKRRYSKSKPTEETSTTTDNKSKLTLPPIDSSSNLDILAGSKENLPQEPLSNPEPLTDEQKEKHGPLIQVYGPFLTACLLSRQFRLREQALNDVSQRLELWRKKHKVTKKGKKLENLSDEAAWSESKDTLKEKIRVDWKVEVEAPEVERDIFIGATFCVVELGLDDTREKGIFATLTLWQLLMKTCQTRDVPKSVVFHYLNNLVPKVLLKSGHMNPRIKQACLDIVVSLSKAYNVLPHSISKYLIKIVAQTAAPRYVVARLDALHEVIRKVGIDDTSERLDAGSGLTVKSIMSFIQPLLQHKNLDIREAAVKVFVDLAVLLNNDELMFSYLEHVRPQLVEIIQETLVSTRRAKSLAVQQHKREINKVLPTAKEKIIDDCLAEIAPPVSSEGFLIPAPVSSPILAKESGQPDAQILTSLKSELDSLKTIMQEHLADSQHCEPVLLSQTQPGEQKSSEQTDVVTMSIQKKQKHVQMDLNEAEEQAPLKIPSTKVTARKLESYEAEEQISLKQAPTKLATQKPPSKPQTASKQSQEHKIQQSHKPRTPAAPVSSSKTPASRAKTPSTLTKTLNPAKSTTIDGQIFDLSLDSSEEKLANSWNKVCIFCNENNPTFTDENLDIHYWRDCPMLCACPLCMLIVEIPTLKDHMLKECANKKMVKQCSRCKEAVMTEEFQNHVERQTCRPHSVIPGVARCPLCHNDVPHGDSGWKMHLLKRGGCLIQSLEGVDSKLNVGEERSDQGESVESVQVNEEQKLETLVELKPE